MIHLFMIAKFGGIEMIALINPTKLLALLRILEPYNNADVPKWAKDVINDFKCSQCGNCRKWRSHYCGETGQITSKEFVCGYWEET